MASAIYSQSVFGLKEYIHSQRTIPLIHIPSSKMSIIFERCSFIPFSQVIGCIPMTVLFLLYADSFEIGILVPIFIVCTIFLSAILVSICMYRKLAEFNGNNPADLLKGDRWRLTIETVGLIAFSVTVIAIKWSGFQMNDDIIITLLCIQTTIFCLIDLCLIWKSEMKPLTIWISRTEWIRFALTADPPNCLVPVTGGTFIHTLFNRGHKKLIYKIKSSNNNNYRITPVFGFIDPSERKKITVTRTGGAQKCDKLDKLVIHYAFAPVDATDARTSFPDVTPFESVTILLITY
uniref:Major sperm protein n=2 Tax=Caenorhabditis tropicalis TaxID=1561998 RepID=A0A1I7T7P1_9PELO